MRAAKNREQPSTDTAADPTMSRPRLELGIPVPIESDADAGFIRRSRRMRHRSEPPLELEGPPPASPVATGTRRRKPFPRIVRRGQETVLEGTEPLSSEPMVAETGSAPIVSSPLTFADTVRHFRAASSSALAGFSPFRSRSIDQPSEGLPLPPQSGPPSIRSRRRSQAALARWFGGIGDDESSSSDEEDERRARGLGSGSVSALSADEMPVFGQMGSAIVDDVGSGEEGSDGRVRVQGEGSDGGREAGPSAKESGVVPIPGGEPVSQQEIDAGATAGERAAQYSPPRQDEE